MEFGVGVKQRLAATDALIHAGIFVVGVSAGERRFSSLLPRHVVLVLRELFLPFLFVFRILSGIATSMSRFICDCI